MILQPNSVNWKQQVVKRECRKGSQ